MRQTIIAGNWKMHGSKNSIVNLLEGLKQGISGLADDVELIVFPPNIYMDLVAQTLEGSGIAWGAQNVSAYEPGAHTGEVAATMLKDFGCRYVLVGHSERRLHYSEDDNSVANKFVTAKKHGLVPILCLGETRAQREAGQTKSVIEQQLAAVLNLDGGAELLRGAVIAYEPVWAIGTGVTATPEQAQEVHEFIRQLLVASNSDVAQELPILYGGSVKPSNSKHLLDMPDIDGGLIGGASLHAGDFLEIAKR